LIDVRLIDLQNFYFSAAYGYQVNCSFCKKYYL